MYYLHVPLNFFRYILLRFEGVFFETKQFALLFFVNSDAGTDMLLGFLSGVRCRIFTPTFGLEKENKNSTNSRVETVIRKLVSYV